MKNLLLSAICIVSLFLSSCQNWIDVNPKTDIEAEEFFTSEDGFKSALTGLYSMMVLEKSYGRQMTFLICCVCGDRFILKIRQKRVFLTGRSSILRAHR